MGLSCQYCSVAPEDAWVSTEFVVAVPHTSPIGTCHLVVAPRRHAAAFYDLDVQEQRMIWDALAQLRQRIAATLEVEGFDAGFVDGPVGELDFHTHIHLIPRIAGQKVELPGNAEWVNLSSET
jgi:diadenosine tetraphosphate (Ap4A) HIT family hydrolase